MTIDFTYRLSSNSYTFKREQASACLDGCKQLPTPAADLQPRRRACVQTSDINRVCKWKKPLLRRSRLRPSCGSASMKLWHARSNPAQSSALFLCPLTGGMPQHINRHPENSQNGWLRLRRCLHPPAAASQGGTLGSSPQYPRWKRRKDSHAQYFANVFNLSVIAYRCLSHGRSRPAVFCRLSSF
jgi:hypothetical protein